MQKRTMTFWPWFSFSRNASGNRVKWWWRRGQVTLLMPGLSSWGQATMRIPGLGRVGACHISIGNNGRSKLDPDVSSAGTWTGKLLRMSIRIQWNQFQTPAKPYKEPSTLNQLVDIAMLDALSRAPYLGKYSDI